MDGIGPITNTRTIDDAIGEAISQLSKAPQTTRVARLLAEVRRYQAVVAAWAQDPPEPDVQFEVIGEVMSVLSTAMAAAKEPAGLDVASPRLDRAEAGGGARGAGSPTASKRRSTGKGMPRLVLDVPDAEGARLDDALDELLPIGDMPDLAPVGGEEGHALDGGANLVCAYREPWRDVAGHAGVRMRLVAVRPSGDSRHLMVRLEPGIELPSHHHDTPEVLLVLDGCIEVGHDLLHAGGFLLSTPGEIGLPLRSLGESTLVLYDTDRSFSPR